MSKAEKTKAYIIEKSATIFNTKGYAGTSLNDIISVTGLTKGSIYGNFKDKNDIAAAVYKYNVAGMRMRMSEAGDKEEMACDKLFAIVTHYRKNWKTVFARGGCPILNASVEADDNLPFLKKNVQQTIHNWAEYLADIINLGKKQNQIRKNIDAMKYAHTMIILIEGGIMMSKIKNNQELLFIALDRVEQIINAEIKK